LGAISSVSCLSGDREIRTEEVSEGVESERVVLERQRVVERQREGAEGGDEPSPRALTDRLTQERRGRRSGGMAGLAHAGSETPLSLKRSAGAAARATSDTNDVALTACDETVTNCDVEG